ncbi:MAG: hypothetical protein LIO86_15585 [Lachnospiraceae bacterium]|nr:hypothetical protein [Lachnospiraceae bacterium]
MVKDYFDTRVQEILKEELETPLSEIQRNMITEKVSELCEKRRQREAILCSESFNAEVIEDLALIISLEIEIKRIKSDN